MTNRWRNPRLESPELTLGVKDENGIYRPNIESRLLLAESSELNIEADFEYFIARYDSDGKWWSCLESKYRTDIERWRYLSEDDD